MLFNNIWRLLCVHDFLRKSWHRYQTSSTFAGVSRRAAGASGGAHGRKVPWCGQLDEATLTLLMWSWFRQTAWLLKVQLPNFTFLSATHKSKNIIQKTSSFLPARSTWRWFVTAVGLVNGSPCWKFSWIISTARRITPCCSSILSFAGRSVDIPWKNPSVSFQSNSKSNPYW